jgi:hypothetical protein
MPLMLLLHEYQWWVRRIAEQLGREHKGTDKLAEADALLSVPAFNPSPLLKIDHKQLENTSLAAFARRLFRDRRQS